MLATARRVAPRSAPGTDPDADILDLVDRGNPAAAVVQLMQRYGVAVYRYCREALHDAALADDVHQLVFIAALCDLPHFARRSPVRLWLFAIARHRVLDAAKRRRTSKRVFAAAGADDVADPRATMDDSLDDARLRAALVASLAELPVHTRTAVLLRYQQGFSFAEMAEICGERPDALCARVSRAMPVLRRRIEARLQPRTMC
jgi:RNA polymerase sigma-70 factor, ECF subfamily